MTASEKEENDGQRSDDRGSWSGFRIAAAVTGATFALFLSVACQPAPEAGDEPRSDQTSARSVSTPGSSHEEPARASLPAVPSAPGSDVLLITIDTLRADALGFSGHERAETPVLDRLAAGGRVFSNAHAHNVVTLPSHTNILTGRNPYEHGVRDNSGFTVPQDVPTLATRLQAAGYETAAFVSAYPLDSVFGLDRGFDTYDDEFAKSHQTEEFVLAERLATETVDLALSWWRNNEGARRFLWLHVFDPHAPYQPPEPWASRFSSHPYDGEIAATDHALGRILKPILDCRESSNPCDDKIFVAMTSDHGESLGEHGEASHGLFAYEATLKVPLVLWGPGITPAVDDRSARHIDLLPTLLAAVGADPIENLPGQSLLAPATTAVDTYFEALSPNLNRGWAPLRGLLRERMKAIHLPLPELYDLAEDPREETNLVDDRRRLFRELLDAIPGQAYEAAQRGAVTPEAEARLRSLGYFTGPGTTSDSYGPEDDPKNLIALDGMIHEVIDLFSTGRPAEAARLAQDIVSKRPDMPNGYSLLAQSLIELGALPQAIAAMETARERGLASESLLIQLGLTLTEVGRARDALPLLTTVAESASPGEQTAALNALGLAQAGVGQFSQAEATLKRVIDLEPRNARAYENLGLVDLRRQRWASAERSLRRALEIDSQLAESWNMLGVAIYSGRRDVNSTIDAWQRCLAIDPNQPNVLINLGSIAFETRRYDIARSALQRFLDVAPPERFGPDLEKARTLLRQIPS